MTNEEREELDTALKLIQGYSQGVENYVKTYLYGNAKAIREFHNLAQVLWGNLAILRREGVGGFDKKFISVERTLTP